MDYLYSYNLLSYLFMNFLNLENCGSLSMEGQEPQKCYIKIYVICVSNINSYGFGLTCAWVNYDSVNYSFKALWLYWQSNVYKSVIMTKKHDISLMHDTRKYINVTEHMYMPHNI